MAKKKFCAKKGCKAQLTNPDLDYCSLHMIYDYAYVIKEDMP